MLHVLPQLGRPGRAPAGRCQHSPASWALHRTAVLSPAGAEQSLAVRSGGRSGSRGHCLPGGRNRGLPSSRLCLLAAGRGEQGGPSPGLGHREGTLRTQLRAQSLLAVPWPRMFMPLRGSFPWFVNGERRAGVPQGAGVEVCTPGPRPCRAPGPVSQPPGALSPPQGLLLRLVLFFTRFGNTHFVHS